MGNNLLGVGYDTGTLRFAPRRRRHDSWSHACASFQSVVVSLVEGTCGQTINK